MSTRTPKVATCIHANAILLQRLAETQVWSGLLKSWGTRVSRETIDAVVADLCGHCFTPTSKGQSAGQQRLASYRGRASLATWLYAIAVKALLDRLPSSSADSSGIALDNVSSPIASQPEVRAALHEAGNRGEGYRQRLIAVLRAALEAMPARRRLAAVLHWVHGDRPAEIATKMEVSRPRISELLAEARQDFTAASRRLCEEIAREAERPIPEIEELLQQQMFHLLILQR